MVQEAALARKLLKGDCFENEYRWRSFLEYIEILKIVNISFGNLPRSSLLEPLRSANAPKATQLTHTLKALKYGWTRQKGTPYSRC